MDACDIDELIVGVSEVDADDCWVRLNSIGPGDGGLVLEADELVSPVDDVVGGGDHVKLGDLVEVDGAFNGSSASDVGVLNEFTSVKDSNLESSIKLRINNGVVASLQSWGVSDLSVEHRLSNVGSDFSDSDLVSLVLSGVNDVDLPLVARDKDSFQLSGRVGLDVQGPVW